MNLHLEDLKTRTTLYLAKDGKERAVLFWEDYLWLIDKIEHKPDFHEITELLLEFTERQKQIMIAQATLDASLAQLTAAVSAAAAALATSSTATSTPDAVVSAYQAGVDAQTVALATATPVPTAAAAAK